MALTLGLVAWAAYGWAEQLIRMDLQMPPFGQEVLKMLREGKLTWFELLLLAISAAAWIAAFGVFLGLLG